MRITSRISVRSRRSTETLSRGEKKSGEGERYRRRQTTDRQGPTPARDDTDVDGCAELLRFAEVALGRDPIDDGGH